MKTTRVLGPLLALLLAAGASTAGDGPDINVLRVGSDASDYPFYGESGGIAAYSMATTSCNPGTAPVNWTSSDHPVIGQNIFRLRDGYFEQLGQSWLKHGFCAVNEGGCGSCQTTPCSSLGVGCADTYWGTLNDGAGGGPKWPVNALNGSHPHPYPAPTGPTEIRGRLQVRIVDIDPDLPENADALWFAEGQYVSAHDAINGNSANNNSWQKLDVVSYSDLRTGGPTRVGEPALFAWRMEDPVVNLKLVVNEDEGGPDIDGNFWVGSRAYDLGTTYRYVYVVQNLTSKQSAASISIPVADELTVSNFYFHDVDYHSGEPFDGTDWTATHSNGMVTFECTQTFQQNPNANAIRWGTAYTFSFEANAAPQNASGSEIGLFEPGTGDVLPFQAWIPGGEPDVGVAYCFGDGSGTFCPCFNFGDSGRGCSNGLFVAGAGLTGSGTPSVTNDTVVLKVTFAISSQPGLFFQGDVRTNGGAGSVFGDGLRCAGTNVVRLETTIPAGGATSTSVSISEVASLQAGDIQRYQYWYRDPNLSPCGNGFNLTNGLEIVWEP